MNIDYLELENRIKNCSQLYIYGAGIIGYGVYVAIEEMFCTKADKFIVSDKNNNPSKYAHVDVIDISDYSKNMKSDDLIVVATPPEYHCDIEDTLAQIKYLNYVLITPDLEYALMGAYLKNNQGITCIEDLIYSTETIPSDAKVYMAVSHKDKELKNKYIEEEYVNIIQVGKARTGIVNKNAIVFDDDGENISHYNDLYGELTATYCAWKNFSHDVTGIFHYRRTLDVKIEQFAIFNEYDAILPLPFVCYPDASGQYGRYLCKEDIEVMKDVIFEFYPELKSKIIETLNSPFLYNYNILIARKEVFDDYCEWIFPQLEEITNRCEVVQRKRFPRYIGRIGEILTSLYFTLNIKEWKITHAPKIWRV